MEYLILGLTDLTLNVLFPQTTPLPLKKHLHSNWIPTSECSKDLELQVPRQRNHSDHYLFDLTSTPSVNFLAAT